MISEMSVIYGWAREYILWKLTLMQLIRYWRYGFKYDMERHGFKFKDGAENKSWEEVRNEVYSDKEKEEWAKWELEKKAKLKKQFGNNIEGL